MTLGDVADHDTASIVANVRQTLAGGRHAFGVRRYRRKDGTMIAVEVGATRIVAGGQQLLCVVARALTELDTDLERRVAAHDAGVR